MLIHSDHHLPGLENLAARTGVRALLSRVATISKTLNSDWQNPNSNEDSPSEHIASFADLLEAALDTSERKVGHFFLGATGKYLSEYDVKRLAFNYRIVGGPRPLLKVLSDEAQRNPDLFEYSETYELKVVAAGELVFDVTDTDAYPLISGIQRVVRRACQEIFRSESQILLVRTNQGRSTFELFSNSEVGAFLSYTPKPPDPKAEARKNFFLFRWIDFEPRPQNSVPFEICRYFFFLLLALLPRTTRNRFSNWVGRTRRAIKRRDPNAPTSTVLVPFFRGGTLVLPELIANRPRVDLYMGLKQQFDVHLGMIAYDLIPIFDAEFSLAQQPFLNYLRLLRVIDKISSISAHTQQLFRDFIQMVDRRGEPQPQFGVHLLAGDFPKVSAQSAGPRSQELPVFLCVGTIEPRKNQVGMLRAARLLWMRGFKFRLLFVGNKGWLNEAFLAELREAQASGLDVQMLRNVTEPELVRLYQETYCTLFCSFSEGFGLPISESHAFGKPCITSNQSSMKEVAEKGGCVLVDPQSVESIAEGMQRVLESPDYYRQLCDEIGRTPARSWSDYAKEIQSFFKG